MQNNQINTNGAQARAIAHGAGAMLVLAGPGSGKTFVITQRIRHLIEVHQVRPENILVITFTKAAAAEMRQRFGLLTQGKAYPVTFGTFHAIFFQILRHTYKFTMENIIRETDKYRLLEEILSELPPDMAEAAQCGARQEAFHADTEALQRILAEISAVKNSGTEPEDYASTALPQAVFEQVFRQYKEEMNRRRRIDFDDMVLLCRNLLRERPDTLRMWQERFEYILIDEFQDICPLQYEVVRLLAGPQDNLFIVGDDDQSIYGFRGARPELMLHFQKDYPEAEQVLLNVNYRSRRDIVEAAGRLIAHNRVRFPKAVTADNPETGGVRVYAFSSKQRQADAVAELILQYLGQEGASCQDIAILGRTNTPSAYIVNALVRAKIPFTMKEKTKNIYESNTAKDILAYLRYALKGDDIADFYRLMNRPVRYIRRSSVPMKPFAEQELLQNHAGNDAAVKNITRLFEQLRFLRGLAPYAAVNYIRKGIGYEAYLKKEGREQALAELEELQACAKPFDTIEEWLAHIDDYERILREAAAGERGETVREDAVQFVTMHASKGLEWKVVILPDVNETVVPHKKAVTDSELEEERRMFYVAMTRARENLFIFYVDEKEAGNLLPSRYVSELSK
ncbi:MAG: ATP-dependent helicase [Roseburia sp.]|nr:ATP-dependent helicase [Roseburia sp.]